uniref:Uncharacterized protein n=1 Tax=Ditylum brightwellii TaxID=49249 RepID=A0A7S4V5L1_9STRA
MSGIKVEVSDSNNDDACFSPQDASCPSTEQSIPCLEQKQQTILPHLLELARESLSKDGYCVLPSVLDHEECDSALGSIWDFVEDISGGMVNRDEPRSWYPQRNGKGEEEEEYGEDPWPHSECGTYPDTFQSYGAGFVLGQTRETLAKKVFEPLLGTRELHCSKEGFTFHRPTSDPTASGIDIRRNKHDVHVDGDIQKHSVGEHFDQTCSHFRSLVSFVQQKDPDDGHFLCYPRSHSVVDQILAKGTNPSWASLTDSEIQCLCSENNIEPKRIFLNRGDIILWKSNLVHTYVPPRGMTTAFSAVGYVSMAPAEFTPSYPGTWKGKLDAYKMSRTGDHRPDVENWYEHRRTAEGKDDVIVQRQRPYYRLSPPMISIRLAELYGLIPYNLTDADKQKELDRAVIRGVRFEHSSILPMQQTQCRETIPICEATTESVLLSGNKILLGQDKYLGGMTSPCGQYVYGVPGHAQRVLRVNTETGEMDYIGPEYPGKFKWLRGVEIPPEVMQSADYPRGCCLALPSNAPSILKINPETNDVFTFGGPMPGKGWMYHGGNLASDGLVYAIPANATRVLVIDPRTDETRCIGPDFPGIQKWYGGILGCDGCVYGIPHNSTGVLRINPTTQVCDVLAEGTLPEGRWKWHGGLASPDGRKIIGFPNNADSVLAIDVAESRVYTIGDDKVLKSGRHRIPQDGRYKYLGGALTKDGRYAYLFPCDAERVLRIDMKTDELSLVGPELLEGENKYQNGFVARDGCLYGIPQRAAGVLRVVPPGIQRVDANGNVMDDTKEHVDVLYCGEDMVSIKDKFEGGVLGLDGCIYCIPLRAKTLLKVVPGASIS